MDEDQATTPLHHAIGRHRGIDAAGDQRHDSAARSYGETAGALNSIKTEKGIARQNFHCNGKFRIREIHTGSGSFLNWGPKLTIDFRRR